MCQNKVKMLWQAKAAVLSSTELSYLFSGRLQV
jgi:hypothetical protein